MSHEQYEILRFSPEVEVDAKGLLCLTWNFCAASTSLRVTTVRRSLLRSSDIRRDEHNVLAIVRRASEISVMRVLGFTRPAVLTSFVAESAMIGLVGDVVGQNSQDSRSIRDGA